ncbi:MAG: diguanylate cyclase [Nitrospirae bacterium]|nr:diguanylate cyclase [Nitrospirota bacterium]
MNSTTHEKELDWLQPLKKRIIAGLLGILTICIAVTMIFIVLSLRSRLIKDSRLKTQELGSAIESALSALMQARDPDMIQQTVDSIRDNSSSIVKAFIIDRNGRIVYSSDKSEIGKTLDRFAEKSCHGCHAATGASPSETTLIVESMGQKVQRNVTVIYNKPSCYSCHPPAGRINGKLIIDRSLKATNMMIMSTVILISGAGVICLMMVIPFLSRGISRGVNRYISEIMRQHSERSLLYMMMERLSKTIDMHELEHIIVEIMIDTFSPDEIDLLIHRDGKDHKVISWPSEDNRIDRKKIAPGSELSALRDEWAAGRVTEHRVSDDRRTLLIPVAKGNRRFALIVARKTEGTFDPERLNLIRAMESHVAVALENAFLYTIAITDELTQLFTQRHFRSVIDREYTEFERFGKKISLLMIDLDDFKKINDTYGHVIGDTLLKDVAGWIGKSVRDQDLVFRYGGEEFAVILPSTDVKGGKHVAERIRKNIHEARFDDEGVSIQITASIGVASCPENATAIKDLILSADKALYAAKHAGKNRVAVSEIKTAS